MWGREKLNKGINVSESHQAITRSVKSLSLAAIEKSKSGHTSFPLAMADIGYELFYQQMNFNPKDPKWLNRDRLILSSGHGSMFLYSFLHLLQYDVSLDDIKSFRQLNSKTPGHPEFGHTEGVECTTGPLGQGISNAVGIALSEAHLSERFNSKNHKIFDHYTYCLCGDGDLMEGVAMEAISFAGHQQLNKLICIYDYNSITIDGRTDIAYTEDVKSKIQAQNWLVIEIDGHDVTEIHQAIEEAKRSEKPTMIIAITISGKGAANWEGTNKIHGNPMKEDDYKESYKELGLSPFEIDNKANEISKKRIEENLSIYDNWNSTYDSWKEENPEKSKELSVMLENNTDEANKVLDALNIDSKDATRSLSGKVLNAISEAYPSLVGGSADLAGSNNTTLSHSGFMQKNEQANRNIHFGVREHAMGGIMNGISYHGVLRPYGGTFLVFSDYMRPSVRLAALSNLPAVYIWTHDSFYVGEDGPTHHPVEHISALRAIPNLNVLRPADSAEVIESWRYILESNSEPVALCLTRQKLEVIDRKKHSDANQLSKGAYILKDSVSEPELIIIASGSELSLAFASIEDLDFAGKIRLVSMPSMFLFEKQSKEYKESVLPNDVRKRFFVEAGSSQSFFKYIGLDGEYLSKDDFSKSAPYQDLEKDFGFTKENLRSKIISYFNN